MADDPVTVLPLPSNTALTQDQARRVTCLALALVLLRGRNVHTTTVWAIAEWLYDGDTEP